MDKRRVIERSADGSPLRVCGTHLDITRRKQEREEKRKMEVQLRQAQKMEAIGTLAGGIAHDFNNILSAVMGYTELALGETAEGTPVHKYLGEVLAAGNRARHLAAQILTISRRDEAEKAPVNLVSLVKEAFKMLRSTIPSSIAIREAISAQSLVVMAEPTQMHQVIVNLATNAKQAMPEQKGVMEVRVEAVRFDETVKNRYLDLGPGDYARIIVSDTGRGIDPAHLDKIFEPYFTTKEKGRGTGLGLSIVHGIVKAHEGHISVYSEPGRGTAFHVYLPLEGQGRAESSPPPVASPLPGGAEHILVVDDEASLVKMVSKHLQDLGYRVTAGTSSAEALALFRSDPRAVDLLVTDMTMPEMTGDQLAREVKAIRPDLPVILCTGFSETIDGLNAADLAISDLLMKPVKKADMAVTVRKALDAQALHKD